MKFSIVGTQIPLAILLSCVVGCGAAVAQQQRAVCSNASFDSDGDGWGWENNQSCIVADSASVVTTVAAVPRNTTMPVCGADAIDPDGDGWGWENNQSCIVTSVDNAVSANVAVVAPRVEVVNTPAPVVVEERVVAEPVRSFNRNPGISDITDLFLITGQSNLTSALTTYDPSIDTVDSRVFAFTEFGTWLVADLHQPWDIGWFPGNGSLADSSRQPYNNFSFHFAKALVEMDPSRVVGFVVASAPGEGISHWDADGDYWQFLRNKVRVALEAQGNLNQIDAVLWHQGETDWLLNGTSDPGASFAERSEANYYPRKLNELIANFRNEDYMRKGIFICGETLRSPLNAHLTALNNDGDNRTGCVQGTDLDVIPAERNDPNRVHFSAQGLRELGRRYAERYLRIDNTIGN